MSPSRTAVMWATPRCRARRMVRDGLRGQHGVHFTCLQPMRYKHATNEWRCADCEAAAAPADAMAAARG